MSEKKIAKVAKIPGEKSRLKEKADYEVVTDADHKTIYIDLDGLAARSSERNAGVTLTRICIVQGGRKLYAWLHLVSRGFELSEKHGFDLVLHSAKNGQKSKNEVTITVKMGRDGYEMEEA